MDGWKGDGDGGGDGGGMQKSRLETVKSWKQRKTKAMRKSLQRFCILVVVISANTASAVLPFIRLFPQKMVSSAVHQ